MYEWILSVPIIPDSLHSVPSYIQPIFPPSSAWVLSTTSPSDESPVAGNAPLLRLRIVLTIPSGFLILTPLKKLSWVSNVVPFKNDTGPWKVDVIVFPEPPITVKLSLIVKVSSSLIWFSVVLPVTALITVLPI